MDAKMLGAQIRKIRIERHLSREQLAFMIGIEPETLRHYECGYKPPRLETLVRIANALNVGTDDLLCYKLNSTRTVVLEGLAKKLEPLTAEQIEIFSDVLDAMLEHIDAIAPPPSAEDPF